MPTLAQVHYYSGRLAVSLLCRYLENRMSQELIDAVIARAGESSDMLPSAEDMRFVGSTSIEEFVSTAHEFFGYTVRFGDLRPDARVLDIGSGIGRMAIPLTRYLSATGSYEGIDPDKRGVEWSTSQITSRHPNFRFHHVDLYNGLYNPHGTVKTQNFVLPWANGEFDMVILMSVFTHLLEDEVEHYVREIRRVLRGGGGKMLATAFLLDADSKQRMLANPKARQFIHPRGVAFVENPGRAEDAVAYPKPCFLDLLRSNGLEVEHSFDGAWSGKADAFNGQDLVVARKSRSLGAAASRLGARLGRLVKGS